jgi:hypothetical protein
MREKANMLKNKKVILFFMQSDLPRTSLKAIPGN